MLGERDLELLKVMADGKLYTLKALTGVAAQRDWEAAGRLARLAELGLVEALELRAAARERGGFTTMYVYRITKRGLEALERAPQQFERPAPRPKNRAARLKQHNPAELLRLMEGDSLWTLSALAKAVGWGRETVKNHLQLLAELVEPVELRMASWKNKTVTTVRAYRLKRGDAANPQTLSRREAQPQALGRSGNPILDILFVMSDGALWTAGALAIATRHSWKTVKLHLERLSELDLVETVEVRMARRKGSGFTVARVYRIAQKGLEALESDQLPPLAVPPRGGLEPPEGGDPTRLALWVLEWSAQAARMLLHLYARGEDSWSGVIRAAQGYRRKYSGTKPAARLLRLRELGLVEWESVSPDRAEGARKRAKRLVRLTEKGREVARAILELTTFPLGQNHELGAPETSRGCSLPERIAIALPTTWEPPEDGNPLRLAIWVTNWSTAASRILLHLRARAGYEDTWYRVAIAAGGYRHKVNFEKLGATLLRLRELGLVEWELLSPERSAALPNQPKRIVRLTEKDRQIADAILKLAALLREEGAESF
jgi:DNA-binding MarR family transcriptional regulator/predicted ArsR family transcriptional regulator